MNDDILTAEKLAEIEARDAEAGKYFNATEREASRIFLDRRALLASHKAQAAEIICLSNACWIEGSPKKPWASEWFIAETTYGARVVLIELPEEYSYDFKTVDETYIKRSSIKRWMQFPDSQYLSAAADMLKAQAAEIERLTRYDEPPLTCPHIDRLFSTDIPDDIREELEAIRDINSQLRHGLWAQKDRATAAEARVAELEAALAVPVDPLLHDQLTALIAKATDENLTDDGRYFEDSYLDLTRCEHSETGEYLNPNDGRLIELLWNNRRAIAAALSAVRPPLPQPPEGEK